MATIHLAGSIALFLFGGVITIFGLVTFIESGPLSQPFGLIYFSIGVVMIILGVIVAQMSKN